MSKLATVFIGIGSNMGSRSQNCLDAVSALERRGLKIIRKSSLVETEPWGLTEQPDFINMVIEAETDLSPSGLLGMLEEIQISMGRKREIKWGPRVIDLDIIFYDDLVIKTDDLTIPHPHMHEREFVLRPLSEIAPEKVHPVFKKTMAELLEDLAGRIT